jgi:hypothetical protein
MAEGRGSVLRKERDEKRTNEDHDAGSVVTPEEFNRISFSSGLMISSCRRCQQLVAVTFNSDKVPFAERAHRCQRLPAPSEQAA